MTIYISNAFSPNMIRGNALLKFTEVTKHDFIQAGKVATSVIGHPEIAEHFNLEYNRIGITLHPGDVLYIVTPNNRPSAEMYTYIEEDKGWTYRRIEVSGEKDDTLHQLDQ